MASAITTGSSQQSLELPYSKKVKYNSEAWEKSFVVPNKETTRAGLTDLFGRRRRVNRVISQNDTNAQRFLGDAGFFTLRLEHRQGGMLVQHPGEERILLFRSDRPGAVAKVIFSSTPAVPCQSATANEQPDEEARLTQMTQAKIHVLDVKEPYRGHDLGGLLFAESVASLRHSYMDPDDSDDDESNAGEQESDGESLASSVRCQLDAEEDIRRHNKLIGFYEKLGCSIKPKAKVQFLNNNDGETYRKIPMQIALRNQSQANRRRRLFSEGSLVGAKGGFLPVTLLESNGERLGLPRGLENQGRRVDWLIVENENGDIQFRTTQGHYLCTLPGGECAAIAVSGEEDTGEEGSRSTDWTTFSLHRVSDDFDANIVSDSESDNDGVDARQKELWVLQSCHGSFLSTDPISHSFRCDKAPAFWQADDDALSLKCTTDTPPRRQHYRKTWIKQKVEYVRAMRERYLEFNLTKMSLKDALDMVKDVPGHPFRVGRGDNRASPSLRTLCFRTAEAVRVAGLPDWVQFVALVHLLGSVVVNLIDTKTAATSEDDYDWTIQSRSRIVGCAAPNRATFGEFRHLNKDERDERYNSPQGMYELHCGLDKILLTWTGPEYLYHMLQHNDAIQIPEEGLAMLRLFSLGDWHVHDEYELLTNSVDHEMQSFVSEFDQLRRSARKDGSKELSDEQCDGLWESHYKYIVQKYAGDGLLEW